MSAVVIRRGQLSERITVLYLSGKWTTFNVVISHILCLILLTYWVMYIQLCQCLHLFNLLHFGFWLPRSPNWNIIIIVLQWEALNSTTIDGYVLLSLNGFLICMIECMYVVRLSVVVGYKLYLGQLLVHAELLVQC